MRVTHQAGCALRRPSRDVGDVQQPVVQQSVGAGLRGGLNVYTFILYQIETSSIISCMYRGPADVQQPVIKQRVGAGLRADQMYIDLFIHYWIVSFSKSGSRR